MNPIKGWSGPITPESIKEEEWNENETKALLSGVSHLNFKPLFYKHWEDARKKRGLKSNIAVYTQDVIEFSNMLDPDFVQKDASLSSRKAMASRAARELQKTFGDQILYQEKNIGYFITLYPGNSVELPRIKFYCHSKLNCLFELFTEFSRNYLKMSQTGVVFKTPAEALNGKSTENRFIVYAPVSTGAAGAAARALKQLPEGFFFPGTHRYGFPISKGIAAVYEDPAKIDDFNTRLIERLMQAYEETLDYELKNPVSDKQAFELFYGKLKSSLTKWPHFASMD